MSKMIRYSEVENLPADHPKMVAFMKQEKDLDDLYESFTQGEVTEDTLEYFDRYIAGDRK